MSNVDTRMQSLLVERAGTGVPFVAIANRAGDFGALPHLVVSDADWLAVAEVLVAHAGVFVMFFLTSTPGVAREIDLLRAAGAHDRTLIVVADEDPRDSSMDQMVQLFGADGTAAAAPEPPAAERHRTPPADFPNQIHVPGDRSQAWDQIRSAIDDLVERARPSPAGELPPLPADHPGAEALAEAHERAVAEFDAATRLFDEREGVAAEDALMRSIAFSHWARDPLGRATALLQLGHVERHLLGYPNEAVQAYLLSLDVFGPLRDSSETARTAFAALVDGLAAYLEELGDSRRAARVRDRLRHK
jgi:hypothetical protein